jgi:hypothetical protein
MEGNLFRTLILGTIGSSNRSESESLILKIYFPWHNTLTSSRFLGPQIFGAPNFWGPCSIAPIEHAQIWPWVCGWCRL